MLIGPFCHHQCILNYPRQIPFMSWMTADRPSLTSCNWQWHDTLVIFQKGRNAVDAGWTSHRLHSDSSGGFHVAFGDYFWSDILTHQKSSDGFQTRVSLNRLDDGISQPGLVFFQVLLTGSLYIFRQIVCPFFVGKFHENFTIQIFQVGFKVKFITMGVILKESASSSSDEESPNTTTENIIPGTLAIAHAALIECPSRWATINYVDCVIHIMRTTILLPSVTGMIIRWMRTNS